MKCVLGIAFVETTSTKNFETLQRSLEAEGNECFYFPFRWRKQFVISSAFQHSCFAV